MQSFRTPAPTLSPQDDLVPRRGPRWLLWGVAIVVLLGVAVGGYFYTRQPRPTRPNYTTVPAVKGTILGAVNSTGQIAPWTQAKLALEVPGRITSVPVKVGDAVKKGDTLAMLDTTAIAIAIRQQEAVVAAAKAKLAAIKAGARSEDILAAQAVLEAAQAKLDGMTAQGRPEDIQSAKDAVTSAKARLHQLQQGAQPADVAAAKTAVQLAQANLNQAQSTLARLTRPPDPTAIQQAESALAQAKSLVWQKQVQRDGACGDPNIASYICQSAQSAIAQAQSAQEQVQSKLDELKQPPHPEDVTAATAAVASAQAALASAQARQNQVSAGALPDDIAQASAAVSQAQQTLATKQTPWRQQDIEQQKQAVAQAAAQLSLKKQPYSPTDIDAAQAAVDGATAQLDQVKYNLAATTLTAPFDGMVAAVNVNVGELASPAAPIPLVTLVDPSNLRLDASVDETDVSHVQRGQDVTVAFDAVPGKTFQGKVLSIAPNATVQSGVASYIVSISVESSPEIKPGMTGNADIIYAHHDDALLVPSRAVRTDGDNRVVSVLEGGLVVAKTVVVGVSDDKSTEIVSGIQPGDQVVLPSTSTVAPAFANGGVRR